MLAIELITGTRAIDLRQPLTPAPATAAAVASIRNAGVAGPGPDRHLAPEIEIANRIVRSGSLLADTESEIGPLR